MRLLSQGAINSEEVLQLRKLLVLRREMCAPSPSYQLPARLTTCRPE
jgi:hypothetical protein